VSAPPPENGAAAAPPLAARVPELLAYQRTLDCVHCGLCLPACPTYRLLGTEPDSPRGRIYLMRALFEGRADPTPALTKHLDLCLGCRACESVCPAGVKYGEMLEATREEVRRRVPRRGFSARLEDFLLRKVVAHPGRLRAATSLVAVTRSLGLASLARKLRLTRLFLGKTAETFEKHLPPIPEVADRASLVGVHPAEGPRRARVGFLEGCVMSQLFGGTNRATLRVLRFAGCEVVVARGQGCCGALHLHQGDADTARGLARANVAAFAEAGPLDAIVVNSAGCGSAMKEYGHLLQGDPRAADTAARVRDVSEFLAALGLPKPPKRVEKVVAYQDACHLLHGQKVAAQPRALLESIEGVKLVPIPDADRCCGSAGIYNLTQPEESAAILDAKLDAIASTGAEIVASGNPGCLLQIGVGFRQRGRPIEVLHTMDLLARALP